MNLQFLINFLLNQLASAIPVEWREQALNKLASIAIDFAKDKVDDFLDWVEDLVTQTENKWDDNLLEGCLWVRNLLGVPDFDSEETEVVKEASGVLQKVSVYPKPYEKMKSELFVLENIKTNQLIPGYSFAGWLDGDTYYFKTKWIK